MRGGTETQQHSEVQVKCGGPSSPSCSEKKPGWGAERRAGDVRRVSTHVQGSF